MWITFLNKMIIQYVIGEQNKIYPLMSGHNTICAATAVLECGVVSMNEPITKFIMEAPAGQLKLQHSVKMEKQNQLL